MATPYAMVSHEKTTSTQDEARHLVGQHPMLVVAGEQSKGRGRAGSKWENAPVALAASLAIRLGWPVDSWPRLTLIAGVAAVRTLGGDVTLKWPNDVMRGEAKLGGILTEVSSEVAVVGWGANLLWREAPSGMGAVLDEVPRSGYGVDLAQTWAEHILVMVARGPADWPVDEYRASCTTIGREITWEPDGRGLAKGVDDHGALLVQTDAGEATLTSGAVGHVRPIDP